MMTEARLPLAALRLEQYIKDKRQQIENLIFEGEAPDMSQETQDALKSLIGDGNAKVTASRQISESDYGTGGHVFVSITLTCDQSKVAVGAAVQWAAFLAEDYAFKQHPELKKRLAEAGITGPAPR